MIKHLLIALAMLLPSAAFAQTYLPSGAMPVQGTESAVRGYPVSTISVASSDGGIGTSAAVTSVAAGALVVKASAGNLFGYNVTSGASAGYILIYNRTTAPADGVVTPQRCIPLAANTGIDVNLRAQPAFHSVGIVIVFSTTGCFSQTASATAFIVADYK